MAWENPNHSKYTLLKVIGLLKNHPQRNKNKICQHPITASKIRPTVASDSDQLLRLKLIM